MPKDFLTSLNMLWIAVGDHLQLFDIFSIFITFTECLFEYMK